MATKGFIKDSNNNQLLPITRAELVLDAQGNIALQSELFLAGAGGKNLPGLITAAERAMLHPDIGQGQEGSLIDIYDKLGYINNGITINGSKLQFYNSNNPITTNIISDFIEVNISNNILSIVSKELHSGFTLKEDGKIIKNIEVDEYGRVVTVEENYLSNNEIPQILEDKILNNSTSSDITTSSSNSAIANKKYVDDKFNEVINITNGALVFDGTIPNKETAKSYLEDPSKTNYYYKVTSTSNFYIENSYIYGKETYSGSQEIKYGDTLIIHNNGTRNVFVHIPSGDEMPTSITVYGYDSNNKGNAVINGQVGSIGFNFGEEFKLSDSNYGTVANISIRNVSDPGTHVSGLLTKADYAAFKTLAESGNTNVSYTPIINTGDQLGTLFINNVSNPIYSISYNLSLNNGSLNDEYNPILKFTKNESDELNLTFEGQNGISIKKSNNKIIFNSLLTIHQDSSDYLTLENDQLQVKIGTINQNGLVDFDTLTTYANNAHQIYVQFESVDVPLNEYQNLINAITITN